VHQGVKWVLDAFDAFLIIHDGVWTSVVYPRIMEGMAKKSRKTGMAPMDSPQKEFPYRKQIRTLVACSEALKRVVSHLRQRGRLKWKGNTLSQEAVFSAVCLWLEAWDVERLEVELAPHLGRLKQMILEETAPGIGVRSEVTVVETTPGKEGPPGPQIAPDSDGGNEDAQPKPRRKSKR
jgi:hypothetical protein